MGKIERPNKSPKPGSFGEVIYLSRMKHGVTLDAAGKEAGFRDGSYVSMIEAGERQPLLERVPRLALAVGLNPVSLCWLWLELFAPSAWRTLQGKGQIEPLG